MHAFELQEKEYENAVAQRYNRDYHSYPIMQSHDDDFACFVATQFSPGDRVVDLGCGSASLWPLWRKYLKNPGALIGSDLSEGMIDEAQKLYPGEDFRVGSALRIPVDTGTVDMVIISSMLHHIPDEHLPTVFDEVHRIMTDDAIVVGREPLSADRLGDEPGWLSGALMGFRHMVSRLTHTREYPEPPIGDYHHAYDPTVFLNILRRHFAPNNIQFKYPVSSFVGRADHELVTKIVRILDDSINHKGGTEIYYAASKNLDNPEAALHLINASLAENKAPLKNRDEFLALLYQSAVLIERELTP